MNAPRSEGLVADFALMRGKPRPGSAVGRVLAVAATAVTVAAVGVLVAAVLLVALVRPGPDGTSSILGHPLLEVASGSMTPTFRAGDLILDNPLTPLQADQLHKGQVITFRSARQFPGAPPLVITHRIVAVIRQGASRSVKYQTKGDANNVADAAEVAPGAILGVYQGFRVPDGAYVLRDLHQPLTFIILAVLLVIVLGAPEFRRRWLALGGDDRVRHSARSGSRDRR